MAFTGLLAHVGPTVALDHGGTLRDVSIHNPEGIADPVTDDEKYIAFALHTLGGKPLAETRHASLSIVSTSFNTGFTMGTGDSLSAYKPPTGTEAGEAPVLVARVAATAQSPALDGMRYTLIDWHMNEIGSGVVADGALAIPSDQPMFCVELSR